MDKAGPPESTGDVIVASRLLMLQSRRMQLASTEKKLRATGNPDLRKRLAKLEASVAQANDEYRAAVLAWAAPETAQFWMVAYATMIEAVEDLAARLRDSSHELPMGDRVEVQADLARLDEIIERWRWSMLSSIRDVRAI